MMDGFEERQAIIGGAHAKVKHDSAARHVTGEAIFIDDIAQNLEPAKKIGMKTAWLINNEYWGKKDANKSYIDYKIQSLPSFLQEINVLKAA